METWGKREFKIGVAVMSNATKVKAFGSWREVRMGPRERRVENAKEDMESVSGEGKWGPKGGQSRKIYLSLD